MLINIVFFIFFLLCIACIGDCIIRDKKERELFNVKGELNVETIMLFSIVYSARKILNILSRTKEDLNIRFGKSSSMLISKDIDMEELVSKLDLLQSLMINNRYDEKNEEFVFDDADKVIFDIWLDYGYKSSYRNILIRELTKKLERGEISYNLYDKVYERAFLFVRSDKEGLDNEV